MELKGPDGMSIIIIPLFEIDNTYAGWKIQVV